MVIYDFPIKYQPAQDVFAAFAGEDHALFLDSADRDHPDARYSYIAVRPLEVVTFNVETDTGDPFELIKDHLNRVKHRDDLPPFQGGAAGYFGYDLARTLESLPAQNAELSIPDMVIGIYDQVIAFDHAQQKAWIIVQAESEEESREKASSLRATAKQSRMNLEMDCFVTFVPRNDKEKYKEKIRRVIDYIHAGDIFQANLAQHFTADLPPGFEPYAHYLQMRQNSPAPFAGYFNAGDTVIASASPERFLQCDHQGRVETKPIKGTRPHVPGMAAELAASAKDRAENIMIVDLLRNDLSKVCTPESVSVDTLCEIETFKNVHHLVSTITGKLQHDKTPLDLLRACFPGGSVTGAPKIRAMEIIEELEPVRRGPYCGALGYITGSGHMDANILIRTLVYYKDQVTLHAGGGIVARSDPQDEYQETFDKVTGFLNPAKNEKHAA